MATAAKKTAEKTAAKAPAKQAPTPYIPSLPKGWEATILTFTGPNGESAVVTADNKITFTSTDGTVRKTSADTLANALRAAGAGIKALDKVGQQEAKAKEAREAALNVLGEVEMIEGIVPEEESTGEQQSDDNPQTSVADVD